MITYKETTKGVVAEIIEAAILELITPLEEVYVRTSKLPDDMRHEWLSKIWHVLDENPRVKWFGAFKDNEIIGCIQYNHIPTDLSTIGQEYVYMGHSYLDPRFRGQGIYSKLRRLRGQHICDNHPGVLAIHGAREDGVTYANCMDTKGHKRFHKFEYPYEVLNGYKYYFLYTYATSPEVL